MVFVAYPGAALIDISGPLAAFKAAIHISGAPSPEYSVTVASLDGGVLPTLEGLSIETVAIHEVEDIDTLIVPGCSNEGADTLIATGKVVEWLKANSGEIRRVCSVCTGTFLLAAAGLVDDKRVATHWAYCDAFSRQFPQVALDRESIYVKDRKIWTSAGATSGIDLALALIEQDVGRKIASAAAKFLVVYLKRPAGQSQYSALLQAQTHSESRRFDSLDRWIGENVHLDLTVADLAEQVAMSPRNFARLYLKATGRTPAKAMRLIRIEAAKRWLVETEDSVRAICRRCGFADEEGMKKVFVREVGISPVDYRNRFAC